MCFYLNNIKNILIITKTVIAFLSTFYQFWLCSKQYKKKNHYRKNDLSRAIRIARAIVLVDEDRIGDVDHKSP